jgi:hypothetical protein
VTKKFYLLAALGIVLLISGGVYAYTYTTAIGTITTTAPTGNIATVNATPTPPNWDTVLTPVSDDIIYRPNAAGDETNIASQYPATGDHWDKVSDNVSDGDGTYVYTPSPGWEEDLYNIPNHSTQTAAGDINYVEVFMVSRATSNATQVSAYVLLKTNGASYNAASENLTTSYDTYSYGWTGNPQTSNPWLWTEIDNLQTGIGMREGGMGIDSLCTQVYTEVGFDAPTLTGSTPTGNLFEITPNSSYNGNLQVRVYLANTDALLKAYKYLNMELYLEDSVEAGKTPNYRLLTLENGVATFNLVGISGGSYIISVTGGTYELVSREPMEWEEGYTVIPELYCEATQR